MEKNRAFRLIPGFAMAVLLVVGFHAGCTTTDSTTGTACASNEDCKAPQVCQENECVDWVEEGCTSDDNCTAPQVCDTETGDCTDPVDEECSSDEDCTAPQVCDSDTGECGDPVAPDCTSDEDCTAPQVCNADTGECTDPEVEGCTSDADCVAPETCNTDSGLCEEVVSTWGCEEAMGAGCPCEENSECTSGWCVPTGEGKVCTKECVEDCPDGFICAGVSNASNDVSYICVPAHTNLCRPCDVGEDCAQLGNTGGYCLPHGEGKGAFCGSNCKFAEDCPQGYVCEDFTTEDGKEVRQCTPEAGVCTCNALATKEGASTQCDITNSEGTCGGKRICGEDGLTECDAQVPKAELCNGQDDNCDNVFDDVADQACEVSNSFGVCAGSQTCEGGKWLSCTAQKPALEICDGQDNDCDDYLDEGFADLDDDDIADCVDPNKDGDTLPNDEDNCPGVANEDQADQDDDNIGDLCDNDKDGDGFLNDDDCDPDDPLVTCTDYWYDGDDDGVGLCSEKICACAPDGAYDLEACTENDCDDTLATVGPGFSEVCDLLDNDCDSDTDEGEPDTDGDGVGDFCDADDDNDGIIDDEDNCPLTANNDQADCEGDGSGDLCDDDDDNDGSLDDDDCEPCNAAVHPQAVDGCNAYNDDCDNEVDENCVYSVQGYAFGNGFVLSGGSADYKVKQSVGTTSFTGESTSADYRVIPVWPVTGPPPEQAP